MATKGWKAIEAKSAISKALNDWRKLVGEGAEELPGFRNGIKWQPRLGFWSYFGNPSEKTPPSHWNAFGKITASPRANMLVQINPPISGLPTGMQGLFATDGNGRRWALHGGRIHPSEKRVSSEEFAILSGLKPVPVRFSDGSERPYFVVCNVDGEQGECLAALAGFISRCERVRLYFEHDEAEADLEQNVAEAEQASNPEKNGKYIIPPHEGGVAERIHADIWAALVKRLNEKSIKHTNSRLGLHGPDLRTVTEPLVMFEIKTDASVYSAYCAVGQLNLYERFSKKTYRKVVVVPEGLSLKILSAIDDIGLLVVHYVRNGKKITFDNAALNEALK